jgi:hypothetical protein
MTTDIEKLYNRLRVSCRIMRQQGVPLRIRNEYAHAAWNVMTHLDASEAEKALVYSQCFGIGEKSDKI